MTQLGAPHHVKSEVLYPLSPRITYETLFERVSVSNDNFDKKYNHVQLERQKGMTDRFTNCTTGYAKLEGYFYFFILFFYFCFLFVWWFFVVVFFFFFVLFCLFVCLFFFFVFFCGRLISESFTSDLDIILCLLSPGSWRCPRHQSYFPSTTFGSVPRSVFSAGQVCRRSALSLCA